MMEIQNLSYLIGILSLTTITNGDPNCITHDDENIVCSAGNTEYILKRGLVSEKPYVRGITLRNCKIIDIEHEAFAGDYSLQYIDLSRNHIAELKSRVLDGNLDVTYLNLSYNLLRELPLGLFDDKPNLEVLDLKGNHIRQFRVGTFNSMTQLHHLDLSSNSLRSSMLMTYLFDYSNKIRFLDFSRNNMADADENLLRASTALDFLNLDRCSLETVPAFAIKRNLNTMKHLMLSTNRITEITDSQTFVYLDKLEILNLADNMIEEIHDTVFYTLKKINKIVLRNNRLKTISEKWFQNLQRLNTLDLSYNGIEFIPMNAFKKSPALKNLNLSHNKFTYLESNFCLELRNAGVMLKKFFFNDNPWQCACLREVLKEMQTYNIGYNFAKYNGDKPVCVTTSQFVCRRQSYDNDFFVDMYQNEIK